MVGEPLARDLPGLGLEEYMLPPRALCRFAGRKRKDLGRATGEFCCAAGSGRTWSVPGFGTELFTGMMLAPEHVNQEVQNKGVEHFIRTAAAIEGAEVVSGSARPGPPSRGAAARSSRHGAYRCAHPEWSTRSRSPSKEVAARHTTMTIEIGPPPEGAVRVDSHDPADCTRRRRTGHLPAYYPASSSRTVIDKRWRRRRSPKDVEGETLQIESVSRLAPIPVF